MTAPSDTPEVACKNCGHPEAAHGGYGGYCDGHREICGCLLFVRDAPDLGERKSSEDRRERNSDVLDSPSPAASDRGEVERPDLEGMQEWHSAFIDGRDVCTHYSPRPMDFITVIRYALYMERGLAQLNDRLRNQHREIVTALRSRAENAEHEISVLQNSLNYERDDLMEAVAEINALRSRLTPSKDVKGLMDALVAAWALDNDDEESARRTAAARQALSDAFASRDADIHDLRLLHSGALAGIASRDAEIAEFQKERIKSSEAYARMLNELRSMSDELASLKARVLTSEEAEQAMRAPFSSTIEHGPAWRSMQDKCRSIRSTLTTQEEKE